MLKKRKILSLIPALSFVLGSTACGEDGKTGECDLAITENSFGQIHLRASLDDIESKFDVEVTTVRDEEPSALLYNIKYCADTNISVNIGKEGEILMLKSASPSFVYHGHKFSELTLELLHDFTKNSEIYWAQNEGRYYFFKPKGTNLTFSLGYNALSTSCTEDYSNCTVEEKRTRPTEVFTY